MYTTNPSIYRPVTKQFTLGGNDTAFGATPSLGASWAYQAKNRFTIGIEITVEGAATNSINKD